MAEILEELFHNKYSKSTISRITDITVPEISKWKSRALEKSVNAGQDLCKIAGVKLIHLI